MVDFTEKRDFQRMVVDTAVEYQLLGEENVHRGIAKNLSGKGMMIIADQDLQPGTQLKIKLVPGNTITPPMQAQLKVIRCHQQDDGAYQLACEIIQID